MDTVLGTKDKRSKNDRLKNSSNSFCAGFAHKCTAVVLRMGKVEKGMLFQVICCQYVTTTYMILLSKIQDYVKNYKDDLEEFKRYKIWQGNKEFVEEHNRNNHGFTLTMNKFADRNTNDFEHIPYTPELYTLNKDIVEIFKYNNNTDIPNSIDWRTNGYVTKVKNEGQHCFSSWAFSVTGSVEGQHFRKTGHLVSLSEQNLIDCSKDNAGCIGGYEDRAFDYIVKNNGIETEASYPYKAKEDSCHFNQSLVGATITGYVNVTSKDECALQYAVATVGPITVTINGSRLGFQLYHSGVYYEPDCSDLGLDRSLLVVGYGNEDGQDYWLAKNSWGTHWGINGYIKMARNRDNNCGIATQPRYPTV